MWPVLLTINACITACVMPSVIKKYLFVFSCKHMIMCIRSNPKRISETSWDFLEQQKLQK